MKIYGSVMKKTIMLVVATIFAMVANAKLVLPNIYANEMVLQQNAVLNLQGKANPNAYVRFYGSWNKENIDVETDSVGNFSIKVTLPEASNTAYTMRVTEMKKRGTSFQQTDVKVFNPVYIGEVWLCSGQSNMQMPVQGSWGMINNYEEEVKNANYPMIKLFQVEISGKCNHPTDSLSVWTSWNSCSPSTVPEFSATAYCYGRELYKELNIPIGLIQSAYGGSNVEAWMSLEAARTIPSLQTTLDKCAKYDFDRDSVKKYLGMANEFQVPTLLYNTMIHPLKTFPIRGAIWYQGEANVGNTHYSEMMDSLISFWRKDWGYQFPFYYVQLAGYTEAVAVQPASSWATLRWEQWKTLGQMENVGMATAVDIGNQYDIHPKNKQELGRRLALVALKNTYGFDVVAEAPVPIKYDFAYRKAKIIFNKKIHVRNDSIPTGFLFQDKTYRSFYEGTTTLLNDTTIEISVMRPVRPYAIYYNWADYPLGNIYGENGLPVLPFRSDQMDLVDGIEDVRVDKPSSLNNVYSTDGTLLRQDVNESNATDNLPKGIYIIGNKKKYIR